MILVVNVKYMYVCRLSAIRLKKTINTFTYKTLERNSPSLISSSTQMTQKFMPI